MNFTQNARAISKLLLILLLLMATIVGGILSYLWVMGYYISLEQVVPKEITVNIVDYAFDYQNTSFFNVTIQCPTSYDSKEPANITQVMVSTKDGNLFDIIETDPLLPYKFGQKGEEETFECLWNWANYTGETVRIIAFVADGSGPTVEAKPPLVDLRIADLSFNSAISVTHFNMTVQNSAWSATHVNVTEIRVATETLGSENIEPSLPYRLDPNSFVTLKCSWDWTNYQNTSVTVAVHTSQGYRNQTTRITPLPLTFEITEVGFDSANTSSLDVTVQSSGVSTTNLDVTRIAVIMDNQTVQQWTVENGTEVNPQIPYTLGVNLSETFVCTWNWTEHRDKNVMITISTSQGFMAHHSQITPAPVILEITELIFDPLDTDTFNVTIENSEFSVADANITEVAVILEDGIYEIINVTDPSLPTMLDRNQSIPFVCTWSWADYSGKNVTVAVQTQEGYSAHSRPILLKALTITDVLFNPLDTNHFTITVQNPAGRSFTIAGINVTVEGEASSNVTDYVIPTLPFLLPSDSNILFMCSWNWDEHTGKNVTVTIETLEDYTIFSVNEIPSA